MRLIPRAFEYSKRTIIKTAYNISSSSSALFVIMNVYYALLHSYDTNHRYGLIL